MSKAEHPYLTPFKANDGTVYQLITLPTGYEDSKDFMFGVSKAKLVIQYLENIKRFIAKFEKPKKSEPKPDYSPVEEIDVEEFAEESGTQPELI